MTIPTDLSPIPNYSDYAISVDGDVWRVKAADRGRGAGTLHRITPVIHPRGHLWAVQLKDDFGTRRRVPVRKLVMLVFGRE